MSLSSGRFSFPDNRAVLKPEQVVHDLTYGRKGEESSRWCFDRDACQNSFLRHALFIVSFTGDTAT